MAERPLFWHYPHYGNQGGAPGAAMLLGDWKLIEWSEDDRIELFHLATDPGETMNRASAEAARVERMRTDLHAWQTTVGALSTTPNPKYDEAKPTGRK
jgi:hypothetical protein